MFHFAMHAVLQGLLFMAAGNVIHALHDEQDIRLMGGLHARMNGRTWRLGPAPCLGVLLPLLGLVQQGGSARIRHGVRSRGGTLDLYAVGVGVKRADRSLCLPALFHRSSRRAADRARLQRQGGGLLDADPVLSSVRLSVIVAWPLQFPASPTRCTSSATS